jgi:hypothetical protein
MIEIEREERSVRGQWRWHRRGRPEFRGFSSEPLLDACRTLKAMGEPTTTQVGLFRPGRSEWDLRTTVGYGASKTVEEPAKRSPRLVNYQPREFR